MGIPHEHALLHAGDPTLEPLDTTLMLSHESGNGLPMNSVLIADRWGEIADEPPQA